MSRNFIVSHSVGLFLGALMLGFSRNLPDSFDLTKAVIALVLAPVIVAFAGATKTFRRPTRFENLVWISLLIGLITSVVVAERQTSTWIGQEHRFTGILVLIPILAVAAVCQFSVDVGRESHILRWLFYAGAIFSAYGLLQALKLDPFRWTTTSFTEIYVFATQGNPNFAAWTASFLVPIALYFMFGVHRFHRWTGALVLAALLCVSASTASIQGPISIAIVVFVLLLISVSRGVFALNQFLVLATISCHQGLFVVAEPSSVRISLSFAILVLIFFLIFVIPTTNITLGRRLKIGAFMLASLSVTTSLLCFSSVIYDQLGERRAFAQSALGVFKEHPFTGVGYEQFQFFFSEYRPKWHAEILEGSISSSAHSFLFAAMASGGVLLTIPLMVVVISGLFRSYRRIGSGQFSVSSLPVVLFSLQVATVALIFVAVEQVAIIALCAVIWSLNLRSSSPRLGKNSQRAISLLAFGSSVLLLVMGSIVSVRWIGGNRAEGLAIRALTAGGSGEVALKELRRAAEWGPNVASAKLRLGYTQATVGDPKALSELMEVTEYLNYASTASQLAVRVASTFDDFEGAIRVLEQALLHEPNGSQLRIFAVDYLEALDDELGSRGQSERLTRIKGSTEYQNLISDELLQELMR